MLCTALFVGVRLHGRTCWCKSVGGADLVCLGWGRGSCSAACLYACLSVCLNDWRGRDEGLGQILGVRLHSAGGMLVAVAVVVVVVVLRRCVEGCLYGLAGDVLQHLG